MPAFKDITGQQFGRLTALKSMRRANQGNFIWLCRCNCGREKEIVGSSLVYGNTRSCGCLQKERVRQTFTKHGESNNDTPEYKSWQQMWARCRNPNLPSYRHYGGRG